MFLQRPCKTNTHFFYKNIVYKEYLGSNLAKI